MQSSYAIILLEIVIVIMISRIKVPGPWAVRFTTAFIGSVPAMAIIGLFMWLLCFPITGTVLIYILNFGGHDLGSALSEDLNSFSVGAAVLSVLKFIYYHPITALAFGPLLSLQALFSGAFNNTGD